jgi:hypothetical protein
MGRAGKVPDAAPSRAIERISRLAACLMVLLVNAVPVVGVLYHGWSVASVLVLYWFENLLVAVCTCIRIAVHRGLTRKRGHWRHGQLGISSNGKPVRGGLLTEYATGAFVFTFAHGVFVAVIVFALGHEQADGPMWRFSWQQVGYGALVVAAMLVFDLVFDLATIRTRSYAWMQEQARRRMGRVVILHLVIIFGMAAVVLTGSPLGIIFLLVGLKTLSELASAAAGEDAGADPSADGVPEEPPPWLLRFAERVGKHKGGAEAFRAHWKRDRKAERKRADDDEESRPA